MNSNNTSNNGPMLFLAGLMFGTVLTALFTPKTGDQMRNHLKNQSQRTADQLQKTTQDLKQKGDRVKRRVQRASDELAAPEPDQEPTINNL